MTHDKPHSDETRTDSESDRRARYAAFTLLGDGGVEHREEAVEREDIGIRRREEFWRMWEAFTSSRLSVVGFLLILLVVLTSVFAPVVAPYPGDAGKQVHFDRTFEKPSLAHPFGTDEVGRDVFSRVLFGSRIALQLGFMVITIAVGIGVPLGLLAGYMGGLLDTVIMRTSDVFLSIPPLVLVLAVTFSLGSFSLETAIAAITLVWWPWYARIVRGEVLSVKEEQFVEASRSVGASEIRIAFREVLPNIVTPITVKATLDMGFAILIGAALSFLGVGAQEPIPDWGNMVAKGREFIPEAWWLTVFPGLAIFITVFGFNLLGDGLRDVLDVEVDE